MDNSGDSLPTLISIVGVDGCGKTTLSKWLVEELAAQGRRPELVWSRFMNYLSKPMLAATRLTGHNYYEVIDGVRFGYHNFERLPIYRELFALLQSVDVNIAAYLRIYRLRKKADIVICERGPWDTLVDVTADTGMQWLPASLLGGIYTRLVRRDARVLWVSRSADNILGVRKELMHDPKLTKRIDIYKGMADRHGWDVVDNDGSLEHSKKQIRSILGLVAR